MMAIDKMHSIARSISDLAGKLKHLKEDYVANKSDGILVKIIKFKNRKVGKKKYIDLKKDSKILGEKIVSMSVQGKFRSLPERDIDLIAALEKIINSIARPKRLESDFLQMQQAGFTSDNQDLDQYQQRLSADPSEYLGDGEQGVHLSPVHSSDTSEPPISLTVSKGMAPLSRPKSPIASLEEPHISRSDEWEYGNVKPDVERTGLLSAYSIDAVDNVRMDIDRARDKLKELTDKNEVLFSPSQRDKVEKSGLSRDLSLAEKDREKLAQLTREISELKDDFGKNSDARKTRGKLRTLFRKINTHRPQMSPKQPLVDHITATDMNGVLVEVGSKVRMVEDMDDPQLILAGEQGIVDSIDSTNKIHVRWDSGRGLALIPGVDVFEIM